MLSNSKECGSLLQKGLKAPLTFEMCGCFPRGSSDSLTKEKELLHCAVACKCCKCLHIFLIFSHSAKDQNFVQIITSLLVQSNGSNQLQVSSQWPFSWKWAKKCFIGSCLRRMYRILSCTYAPTEFDSGNVKLRLAWLVWILITESHRVEVEFWMQLNWRSYGSLICHRQA